MFSMYQSTDIGPGLAQRSSHLLSRETNRNTGPAAQAPMVTVSVTSLAAVLKECVSAVRFVMGSPPPSLIVVWCICRIRRKKNGEREVKERDEESE